MQAHQFGHRICAATAHACQSVTHDNCARLAMAWMVMERTEAMRHPGRATVDKLAGRAGSTGVEYRPRFGYLTAAGNPRVARK